MNARKSLLFFCSVLAGLVLLCICFPSEGIPLGRDFRLYFPNLTEVMTKDSTSLKSDEPVLSPEELLQMRQEALNTQKIEEFRTFCTTNAARIYMPGNDETYFDELWEELECADIRNVRIMHYGDSQIECDRITSLLRQKFQEDFGGMGVGMVPALQTIQTYTLSSAIWPDSLPQYLAYGPSEMQRSDRFYGPLARTTHIPGYATIRLRGREEEDYSLSSRFNRITVMTKGPAKLQLTIRGEREANEMPLSSGSGPYFYSVSLAAPTNGVTIGVQGQTDILGIQLDGTTGVSMDNIPMRGSTGSALMNINRASMTPFFERENVALVILQFGGNSTPYLNDSKLHEFKEGIKRLIHSFQTLAPKAKVLFIGPADMARRNRNGAMETYPIMPALNDSLRAAADEAGAAYWNMYEAMGGWGSIINWVKASPQLDGPDYIHFTPLGAKKIAQLLYDTLHLYYHFYLFRTGQEEAELTAEDSAAVNIKKDELQE